ncbi:MAG: Hint domain-containing protein [Pseudomonadota bacterium]
MASFDPSSVSNLIGLWDFENGNKTKDTGLDDGLAQNGTFESDAFASGGQANFSGSDDRFDVEGDNGGPLESAFDLSSGTIEVQFSQENHLGSSVDTIVNRGEFADRDSEGYFSIAVTEEGAVQVIHFSGNGEKVTLSTSDDFFELGDTVNVEYTWDETQGVQLTVTNGSDVEVISDDTTGLSLDIGDNDDEIFTFGAREADDGKYTQEFEGTIDYVAVYESTLGAEEDGIVDGEDEGELMELGYDDSNDPTDGGGDMITDDGDLIYGNGGSDTIDGAGGDDIIFGDNPNDSESTVREIFKWGDADNFGNNNPTGDFALDTGSANISFSITNNGNVQNRFETTKQNIENLGPDIAEKESFESVLRNDGDSATYEFESDVPLEDVQFRVNDLDGDGVVKIRAFDADGNPIEVIISQVGSDLMLSDDGGFRVIKSTDDDYTPDNNPIHSFLVTIPGPVVRWEIVHEQDGDNDTGINFTDIEFEVFDGDTDAGDDEIKGGDGNDIIDGGFGDDTIDGEADNDTIIASSGSDEIDGGEGRDTYDARSEGAGNFESGINGPDEDGGGSTLGDETIIVTVNDDGDGTVEKLNDGTTDEVTSIENFVAGESPDEADAIKLTDAVLKSDIATDISNLDDTAEGVFTPADGGPSINFGPGTGTTLSDILTGLNPVGDYKIIDGDRDGQVGNISFENFETVEFSVACFVRGTNIATRRGAVAIEDLTAGDDVITMDHGFQKIRWIGSTTVPATGDLAPIVIRKGAMGNERDLRVSPQHRMLVRGWHVELMFDQKEALVPAKALINDETVFPLEGGTVDYFHMMFDTHELVYAEGIPSESFHPGHVGLGSFSEDTREEILSLFPQLRDNPEGYSEHARPSLKVREAKVLAENPELMKD